MGAVGAVEGLEDEVVQEGGEDDADASLVAEGVRTGTTCWRP